MRPTFEEFRRLHRRKRALARLLGRQKVSGYRFHDKGGPDRWVCVTRDPHNRARWRATYGEGLQPHGHDCAKTLEEAIIAALDYGADVEAFYQTLKGRTP